ncbi:MAG: indole-3-glycerol phosphate synthase TrpC [Planctomycetota bacterium]
MATILDKIVETKREELARARAGHPLDELTGRVRDLPQPRDFYSAVAARPSRGVNLIAEIKRKSPSAGVIRPDFDPVAIAQIYQAHGAGAISVLTDQTYFDGRIEFIGLIKQAVPLPVLRKDFLIDPYQVYESRLAGADAVLLIGEVLDARLLSEMLDLAHGLGMTSLIEVHEAGTLAELQEVIGFPNPKRSLLGINNRDLKIQQTDISTTEKLAQTVAAGTVVISESGIKTPQDVQRLIRAGANALLIGETFMQANDIGAKINELLGPMP